MLVACEFSGIVRDAFTERGHDAMSCDLLDSETPGEHYKGDVLDVLLTDSFDLIVAHPPCTYLNRAGYFWCNHPDSAPGVVPLKGTPRKDAMRKAANFFRMFLMEDAPRICIENPQPIIHAGLPRSTQTVQPHMFGHPEFKATCFWLKGLPPLVPTNQLKLPEKGTDEYKSWSKVHRMTPGPNRWKERSRFFPGIAAAMADQWGSLK